ncbi:AAA family ATPase [Streptomyces sp. 3MP-14]|uniref:AAA family ATPase n=1 Tax=Streptomyces mimosae TaxID=2586635 RepID=A0A5N6AD20_9ACTN|nr:MULTISPECIES: AAA family ATPase [Streptomyces]KAB8165866.1 AAA family ATPase [Streptomyces mimosae]KAB8176255.1 AAA family ATPase [Streptomyces sp. 3MP-14]
MHTRTISPVFVGRAAPRSALREALRQADASVPQTVLIGGEAGVGKTRLVEEFLAEASGAGALTVVGACVEVGADGLPFAPVSAVLRVLHRELGDELAEAAAGFGGELSRLLPELGPPSAPDRAARDQEVRGRLFELTARLLERLAERRTLVVVIEDLHWSDRSTRELLGYVFRVVQSCRLLVVTTYRSDDIHRRHPLRPFLAELDRLRTVRRIELPRLTRDEVCAQLTGILGQPPHQDQLDQVFGRSDGNAFFVEELASVAENGRAGALSDSVRDLLLLRVEALPETAQRVVRVAAEGGSRVEFGLLRAVAGLTEEELIDALRAAVEASVLRAGDDDTYRFRHALTREAVDDDLLPGERSRLSRRYAEALEGEPGLVPSDQRATRLASYWYHAHEPSKALPAVLAAAAEARCRHAYAEQLQLLERAAELWDGVPVEERGLLRVASDVESYPLCECPDEMLGFLDLLAEMTLAARFAGEQERGVSVAKRALRLLEGMSHPLRAAWFWTQLSRLLRQLGRGDGWRELGRAQELLDGFPPSPVHALVLTEAAGWCSVFASGPGSLATAERAVELARTVGEADVLLNARISLGSLLIDVGEGERGLAEMRYVAERVVPEERVGVFTRSHVNLQSLLEGMGRSEESLRVADEALTLAHRYGLADTRSWIAGNRADALFSLGRWAESDEACEEALRSAQSPVAKGLVAQRRARMAVVRGQWEEAERQCALHQSLQQYDGAAAQTAHPAAEHLLTVASVQGRILDAREIFAEVVRVNQPPGTGSYTWPLLHEAARAESRAVGVPAAEPGQPAAIELIRSYAATLPRDYPVWIGYARLVEAELRRAEGRVTAEDWAGVAAAFDGLCRPYEEARVRLRWAEALLAEGERQRAAAELTQAHRLATELGAAPVTEEAERLAARGRLTLGGDLPEAATGPDALGLTPRELDVLALVAAGRSNRQIAEELFISPKTASVHVSNILAKLEVTNRGEAAALAHRLRLVGGGQRVAG